MTANTQLLSATDPRQHVTVSASAGTGKTWLLITRLIRLLMTGAEPGNIIAMTFTRKAAGEMRERLQDRLRNLAQLPEQNLDDALQQMGIETTAETRLRAQQLHEHILFAQHPIRITTFHAFCQNILNRFPIEANIPPGFELLATTAILQDQAWDRLFLQATRQPDSKTSLALELLFDQCNGIHNTREALLKGFLAHRNDWWAYTEQQADPVQYALEQIKFLITDIPANPIEACINQYHTTLENFQSLLQQHPTSQNLNFAQQLQTALANPPDETAFTQIKNVFFSLEGEPRKRELSKTLITRLGEPQAQHFIQLHTTLCSALITTWNNVLNQKTWALNAAWYLAGQHLLDHYQRIKHEQRLLDFADLEWQTYTLLHNTENALWIQYKLDQKIDHLLIDEFQDTNPTQWRLLLPILEEISSGGQDRQRSVFLVGDTKQSIYGFRRANPELQNIATDWLQTRAAAINIPLTTSWRSSPAITDCLNRVFHNTAIGQKLGGYLPHNTHRQELWGHVEILPLITPDLETKTETATTTQHTLRNPLLTPRSTLTPSIHYREARQLTDKIQTLITSNFGVTQNGTLQKLDYSHILILFKNRTHIADYEQAFVDTGIPYTGTQRGGLLDSPEIADMQALLSFLATPFNNLALAQILRSPLFSVSDNDLMQLAQQPGGSWQQRLHRYIENGGASATLQYAQQQLQEWRTWLGYLPLHDLLDKIYQQGNVLARYHASATPQQRNRVVANLKRFIEIALETDSGRYPSMLHFLARLQKLRADEEDQPDMPEATDAATGRVRLLTIHAAKGLEAPIIFLADTANTTNQRSAYQPMIEWPAHNPRPTHFLLAPPQQAQPTYCKNLQQKIIANREKEEANLLYVALSRAQHALFISGSSYKINNERQSWYSLLQQLLNTATETQGPACLSYGTPQKIASKTQPTVSHHTAETLLPHTMPKTLSATISPSRIATAITKPENTSPEHARLRGLLIHDFLRQLTAPHSTTQSHPYSRHMQQADPLLIQSCWQEAIQTTQSVELQFIFSPRLFDKAWNEVPITYSHNDHEISGIIDRLVITGRTAWVIDYKTQANLTSDKAREHAAYYQTQLQHYVAGINKLNITETIKAGIVFTAGPWFYALE